MWVLCLLFWFMHLNCCSSDSKEGRQTVLLLLPIRWHSRWLSLDSSQMYKLNVYRKCKFLQILDRSWYMQIFTDSANRLTKIYSVCYCQSYLSCPCCHIHFNDMLGDTFVMSWVRDAILKEKFSPPFVFELQICRFWLLITLWFGPSNLF